MTGERATTSQLDRTAVFSGRRLLSALAGILLLAFVLPAVGATALSRARIARAWEEVGRMADQMRRSPATVEPGRLAPAGEMPRVAAGDGWAGSGAASPSDFGLSVGPDPWGNRYLVNVGVRAARPRQAGRPDGLQVLPPAVSAKPAIRAVWVLSAGPNGAIETPFEQPSPTARLFGDDVGARIW